MNSEANVDMLPEVEGNSSQRTIWAALVSLFLPGVGQLFISKRKNGWIFIAVFAIWIWLFLPPFRLPRIYWALIWLIYAGVAILICASWDALCSGPKQERSSLLWLFVLIPLSCLAASAYWGFALHAGGFHVFNVPSSAMEPTVMAGDSVLVDMRYFEHHLPHEGEVSVMKSPRERGVIVIKRIAAVGGDTIQSANNQISLDGKTLEEPYAKHMGNAPEQLMNFGPELIPPHKIFAMGDNRDVSLDSRMEEFGLVDESALIGKVLYIVRPGRTGKPIR